MSVPHRPRPARAFTSAHAFTLVELLVVIGIIALLISILLPALGKAREQGKTIKCLSNMRQIAMSANAYTSANKGYLLPADVQMTSSGGSDGRTWTDTWVTILVADKYLSYPPTTDEVYPPTVDNVFHCPSGEPGVSQITNTTNNIPSSRTDAQGAFGYMHKSAGASLSPGLVVFSWYGINGISDPNSTYTPFRRISPATGTTNVPNGYSKINAIRKVTEFVFIFDGLIGLNYMGTNANRINARHADRKMTNVAFYDGHAESLYTKDIPGGIGNAPTSAFAVAALKGTYPQWRLEQQ